MQISEARVERLVIHRVGNPSRGEPLQLSGKAIGVDEAVSALILDGYLKGIVSDKKKFQFVHETDLNLNELYHYSRRFFRGEVDLLEVSGQIAKHLYARSQHPNIAAGDLLIILFSGLGEADAPQRALGIFKAEIQEDFLTIIESGEVFDISHASGINPRLIDKGALVLESGPTLYAVDRLGHEAKFWLDDFLRALRVPDSSSTSKLVAEVIEQVAEEIADPAEQLRFREEVLTHCKAEPEVSPRDMADMAERYVPANEVNRLFDSAAESYGFSLQSEAPLPAQGVAKRLEKFWSKVGVGHGVSLLLPSDLSLQNVQSVKGDNGELTLTLHLLQREE
ncbi:nucleoid-associated protein [Vogesella oryzae]|uniref:nucleoid-associated protein n=1 Tax=Vogesella oryzae TaxID=1735285 RepID=UPI001581FAA8|nr:nucleoid-associated protein [Vogesella oryzae]